MIEAGEVGEPVSAVLQSRDPDAPPFAYVKGGGGLFKDMGEHIRCAFDCVVSLVAAVVVVGRYHCAHVEGTLSLPLVAMRCGGVGGTLSLSLVVMWYWW